MSTEPGSVAPSLPEPEVPTTTPQVEPPSSNEESLVGTVVVLTIVGLVVVGLILYNMLGIGDPTVEVVTSAELISVEDGKEWQLSGRVIFDGDLMKDADVWAIATDDAGNRYSPGVGKTDDDGSFTLGGIPENLGTASSPSSILVTIFAKIKTGAGDEEKTIRGKDSLSLGERGQTRLVRRPIWSVVLLPVIFVASILLAVIQFPQKSRIMAFTWYVSVVLAVGFTAAMVVSIAAGLSSVSGTNSTTEVLSLGFMSIYHGTYVQRSTLNGWCPSHRRPGYLDPTP